MAANKNNLVFQQPVQDYQKFLMGEKGINKEVILIIYSTVTLEI